MPLTAPKPQHLCQAGVKCLALFFILLLIPTVGASHQAPGLEDFEDFDSLETPDDDWYNTITSGSGGSFLVSGLWGAQNSTRSVRYDNPGAAFFPAGLHFTNSGFDICDNLGVVEFRFNQTQNPTGTYYIGVSSSITASQTPSTSMPGFFIQISTGNVVSARSQSGSAATTSNLGLTLENNTEYHFRLKDFDCTPTTVFTLQELTTEQSVTVSASGTIGSELDKLAFFTAANADVDSFMDNVDVVAYVPPDDVTQVGEISYSDLVSVDSSNSRNTLIVRYANGTSVATINGAGMTEIANITGTCVITGGVSVTDDHALRFDCDGGGVPDELQFTDTNLTVDGLELSSCGFDGAPTATCDTDAPLGTDTDIVEVEILSDPALYLSGVDGAPTTIAKFGFTTTDNSFHAARFAWNRFSEDNLDFHKTTRSYGSTSPLHPCNIDDSKIWVSGQEVQGFEWGDDETEPEFESGETTSTGTGWSPVSFHDCGISHMAAAIGSQIIKFSLTPPFDTLLTISNTLCGSGGEQAFAMSGDGNFLACSDGNIINFTSGEIAGTFTPRGGVHERLYFDRFAQYIWHATDTGITRYEAFNVTTGDPVGGLPGTTPTPTPTTPAGLPGGGGVGTGNEPDNVIGRIKILIDDAWGWDPLVSDWLFTILIIGFTVSFAIVKLGGAGFVVATFALLGTGLAMAFGYVGVWLVLVLVFIFIAVTGNRLFGGNNEAS